MRENAVTSTSGSVTRELEEELKQQLLRFNTLARTSLQYWDVDPDSDLLLLKHRENAVYQVRTPDAEKYALRVHRAGYHSNDALRSELQWMSALNDGGVLTPQGIKTRDGQWFVELAGPNSGENYQIDLLSWVDSAPLGSVEEGLSGDVAVLASNYRQVGVLAGRLHNQSENWQQPEGFIRHAWDIAGCFSENAVWGRFSDLEALTAQQLSTLESARKGLIVFLTELGKGPEFYGLLHCDLVPENLMGAGDDIYLIDFDDSGFGWHLFELATSLFFLLGEPYFDEVFAALVDGYRSERDLSDEHLAQLPAFFLLRALVYLGWAHTRKETETAKEMTPMIVEAAMEMATAFLNESNN